MAIATTTILLLTCHILTPTAENALPLGASVAFGQDNTDLFSEAAPLTAEQTLDPYTEAEKLYERGEAGWDGIQRYKSALVLLHLQDINAEPSELEGALLVGLGDSYDALSNYRQGIEYYQQALEVWQVLDNRPQAALTWQKLGMSYESLKERESAEEAYQKALMLYQEIGDRLGEEKTLQYIQAVQPTRWWLSKLDQALVRKILIALVFNAIGTYFTLKSLNKKKIA